MKVVSPGAKDSSEVCKAQGLVASGQSGLRSQPGGDLQELLMCLWRGALGAALARDFLLLQGTSKALPPSRLQSRVPSAPPGFTS